MPKAERSTPLTYLRQRSHERLARLGLSQAKFAELLSIEVATLRNWEQGRREPTGPARALLRAIRNNPIEVIKALSE